MISGHSPLFSILTPGNQGQVQEIGGQLNIESETKYEACVKINPINIESILPLIVPYDPSLKLFDNVNEQNKFNQFLNNLKPYVRGGEPQPLILTIKNFTDIYFSLIRRNFIDVRTREDLSENLSFRNQLIIFKAEFSKLIYIIEKKSGQSLDEQEKFQLRRTSEAFSCMQRTLSQFSQIASIPTSRVKVVQEKNAKKIKQIETISQLIDLFLPLISRMSQNLINLNNFNTQASAFISYTESMDVSQASLFFRETIEALFDVLLSSLDVRDIKIGIPDLSSEDENSIKKYCAILQHLKGQFKTTTKASELEWMLREFKTQFTDVYFVGREDSDPLANLRNVLRTNSSVNQLNTYLKKLIACEKFIDPLKIEKELREDYECISFITLWIDFYKYFDYEALIQSHRNEIQESEIQKFKLLSNIFSEEDLDILLKVKNELISLLSSNDRTLDAYMAYQHNRCALNSNMHLVTEKMIQAGYNLVSLPQDGEGASYTAHFLLIMFTSIMQHWYAVNKSQSIATKPLCPDQKIDALSAAERKSAPNRSFKKNKGKKGKKGNTKKSNALEKSYNSSMPINFASNSSQIEPITNTDSKAELAVTVDALNSSMSCSETSSETSFEQVENTANTDPLNPNLIQEDISEQAINQYSNILIKFTKAQHELPIDIPAPLPEPAPIEEKKEKIQVPSSSRDRKKRNIIKFFKQLGYELDRTTGSHGIHKNESRPTITVPKKGTIKKGTLNSIVRVINEDSGPRTEGVNPAKSKRKKTRK